MEEKKDEGSVTITEDKITELKVKACDLFMEQIKLRNATNRNAQASQEILNQIEQLVKEK